MVKVRAEDRLNKKYGSLKAIGFDDSFSKVARHYWFRCDCGKTKSIEGAKVFNGSVTSCGCMSVLKMLRKTINPIEATREAKRKPELYALWSHIMNVCYKEKHPAYKYYGGKGIEVHELWRNNFLQFVQDVGQKETGFRFTRKDSRKGFSPENCVWQPIDKTSKQANEKGTDNVEFVGFVSSVLTEKGMTEKDLSERSGLQISTIRRILNCRGSITMEQSLAILKAINKEYVLR